MNSSLFPAASYVVLTAFAMSLVSLAVLSLPYLEQRAPDRALLAGSIGGLIGVLLGSGYLGYSANVPGFRLVFDAGLMATTVFVFLCTASACHEYAVQAAD